MSNFRSDFIKNEFKKNNPCLSTGGFVVFASIESKTHFDRRSIFGKLEHEYNNKVVYT
jgi:hypothetical protein